MLEAGYSGGRGKKWVLLSAYGLASLLTATFLALSLVLGWSLIDRATSDAASMAAALEQYVERTLEVSAMVTADGREYLLSRDRIDDLATDRAAHEKFRELVQKLSFDTPMIFVNARGQVLLRSDRFPPGNINLADRNWFKRHHRGEDQIVSEAIHSRVINRMIFTYTESVRDRNGELLGAINLGIPSDVVIGPGSWEGYGSNVGLAVIRADGFMVARNVLPDTMVGRNFPIDPRELKDRWTRIDQRKFDGRYALISSVGLPAHGLTVHASIPLTNVLAPLGYIIGIGLPLLVFALAGTFYITRTALRSFDDLERFARENAVLFQEVHHRVKNNLQIISSLLQQQSRLAGEEAADTLNEATARIRAMALVHEQIYGGASPSRVELKPYLRKLSDALHQTFGAEKIRIEHDLEPVSIDLSHAIPLALITTEALSNTLKHAFPHAECGRICLSLHARDGHLRLEVSDNGVGMPKDVVQNLGLTVIRGLAQQLNGNHGFETNGGTTFWLEWPEKDVMASVPARPAFRPISQRLQVWR